VIPLPPERETPPQPWHASRPVVAALVATAVGLLAVGFALWYLKPWETQAESPARPVDTTVAAAADAAEDSAASVVGRVRTRLTRQGDSLLVVTRWSMTGRPVEVRVALAGDTVEATEYPSVRLADSTTVAAPARGGSVDGISCVRAVGEAGERCTPWRFVRPSAAARAGTGGGRGVRIVVRPDGLQVDPDTGAACAEWRAANPRENLWLEVNERAVPQCMGPNDRPVVAQFCAFALLPGGRKAKTASASNNPYCDQEFLRWVSERAS
jgi:hypothetical protein